MKMHLRMLAKAIQIILIGLLVLTVLLIGLGMGLSEMQGQYLDRVEVIKEGGF